MLKLMSHHRASADRPKQDSGSGEVKAITRIRRGDHRRRQGGGRNKRSRRGGHRSLWLKLRCGTLSTIEHPNRLHEQVQVHPTQQLVKIDKFLITLGVWVGGNNVCHVRLEDDAADQLFCLRFDSRYRVRVVPFLGTVKINDDVVSSRGAVLDVGDILECGPYTFQMVPKPSAIGRRGPLARPDASIVFEEKGAAASPSSEESSSFTPTADPDASVKPKAPKRRFWERTSRPPSTPMESEIIESEDPSTCPSSVGATPPECSQLSPATAGELADHAVDEFDVMESEEQSTWAADFDNAFEDDLDDLSESDTLVVHEESGDSDVEDLDPNDIEATDSSVSLSLATASRLRPRDSDGEFPIAGGSSDPLAGDEDDEEMSSSRSAWRRPRFATAGQTVEPFVVSVPSMSEESPVAEFADVYESISKHLDVQDFGAVVLDFHLVQEWSPRLIPELIQLCEEVESRGGVCAASRLDVDFLPEFQNSGLPECFTLFPTTERAIDSLM